MDNAINPIDRLKIYRNTFIKYFNKIIKAYEAKNTALAKDKGLINDSILFFAENTKDTPMLFNTSQPCKVCMASYTGLQ